MSKDLTIFVYMNFEINDRVRVKNGSNCANKVHNKIGTIKYFRSRGGLGVEFDEHITGHSGDNQTMRHGYGWNVYPVDLEILDTVTRRGGSRLEFMWP